MIGVLLRGTGERIGTVGKFMGHRPAERWVAWTVYGGWEKRFRLRREAVDWLFDQHEVARARSSCRGTA